MNNYSKKKQSKRLIRIESTKGVAIIIEHFSNYPLKTQKLADYKLWEQAYNLVLNKKHLTIEGLNQIVAIRASLNLGLQKKLLDTFSSIVPPVRPKVIDQRVDDPN